MTTGFSPIFMLKKIKIDKVLKNLCYESHGQHTVLNFSKVKQFVLGSRWILDFIEECKPLYLSVGHIEVLS